MAKNFDITKDYAFGDMNPILPKPGKIYRDHETEGIEAIAQSTAETYETETILGTGPYKAICLRVENAEVAGGANPTGGSQKMSWLDRMYSAFEDAPDGTVKFLEVKATIPELHGAMFPPPKSYSDHSAINRFPTFVARIGNQAEPAPVPGDVIWVDFGNRATLQDPQYLGPLISTLQQQLDEAGAKTKPCTDLTTAGPNGDPIKSTSKPVATVGPTMAPEYQPIDIELERGKIPKGKGVFLGASLIPLKLADHPVKKALKAGISWVSIYVYKIKKNGEEVKKDIDSIRNFIDVYHKAGIRCYIYGWASIGAGKGYNAAAFKKKHGAAAEPEEMFITNMIEIATWTGAIGIEIDAEEDCWAKGTSKKVDGKWMYSSEVIERNENFARRLKEQCEKFGPNGITLGFTSTTPAKWSPKSGHYFKSWGKYCDYVVPQVYSASGFWSPNHWKKGYERYVEQGFKNVIPGMGAYDVTQGKKKYPKLPDRMRWELHTCYGQNLGWADAITWWAWPQLDHRDRWSVVKELGSAGQGEQSVDPDEYGSTQPPPPATAPTPAQQSSTPAATPAQQSSTPVSAIGPPQPQTPATSTKAKSAQVVRQKKPSAFASAAAATATAARKAYKTRDFSKHPITRLELLSFTEESPAEIDRLLNVTDPTKASASPAPEDQQRITDLKEVAQAKILFIRETVPLYTAKIKMLESEIIGLKKDLNSMANTGNTSNSQSTISQIKAQIINKESQIKSLLEANPKPATVKLDPRPCPRPSTSSDGDPTVSNAKTTVELVAPPTPWKENRVRAHVYGYIDKHSPLLVNVTPSLKKPNNPKSKVHVLVAKRFNAMNKAWVKHSGKAPIQLLAGWQPSPSLRYKNLRSKPYTTDVKYKRIQALLQENPAATTFDLFKAFLIDEYGERAAKQGKTTDKEIIKFGRQYRGWFSPHSTGLAMDFYYKDTDGVMNANSKRRHAMELMQVWKWLKSNAHLYGFSPYRQEPWHWECQIPLQAYKTGKEFTNDFAVYVEEKSVKTKNLTSHSRYASIPFT